MQGPISSFSRRLSSRTKAWKTETCYSTARNPELAFCSISNSSRRRFRSDCFASKASWFRALSISAEAMGKPEKASRVRLDHLKAKPTVFIARRTSREACRFEAHDCEQEIHSAQLASLKRSQVKKTRLYRVPSNGLAVRQVSRVLMECRQALQSANDFHRSFAIVAGCQKYGPLEIKQLQLP